MLNELLTKGRVTENLLQLKMFDRFAIELLILVITGGGSQNCNFHGYVFQGEE